MQLDFNDDGRRLGMQLDMVYGVGDEDGQRVRGGPDWLRSERYTIEAVVGSGRASSTEAMSGPVMFRARPRSSPQSKSSSGFTSHGRRARASSS